MRPPLLSGGNAEEVWKTAEKVVLQAAGRDAVTLVEAQSDGWWYSPRILKRRLRSRAETVIPCCTNLGEVWRHRESAAASPDDETLDRSVHINFPTASPHDR